MPELITVITPTIGRQSLARALDSVANQTIPAKHLASIHR